jgi:hypothetical protein
MMPWRDAPTNTEERKPWAAGLIDPALCKFDGVEAAFEALWHDRKPHQLGCLVVCPYGMSHSRISEHGPEAASCHKLAVS